MQSTQLELPMHGCVEQLEGTPSAPSNSCRALHCSCCCRLTSVPLLVMHYLMLQALCCYGSCTLVKVEMPSLYE